MDRQNSRRKCLGLEKLKKKVEKYSVGVFSAFVDSLGLMALYNTEYCTVLKTTISI